MKMISLLKKLSLKKKNKQKKSTSDGKSGKAKSADQKPNAMPTKADTKQNDRKSAEKCLDAKTSTSETTKPAVTEKRNGIALAGNYLNKDQDKQKQQSIPAKPMRKTSPQKAMANKESENKGADIASGSRLEAMTASKKMNTTLDSIAEMNNRNITEVKKSSQNIKETRNSETSQKTAEESLHMNAKEALKSGNGLPAIDLTDCRKSAAKEAIARKALALSLNGGNSNTVSGYVKTEDIDLKTAKCVLCLHLVSDQIQITVCSHIYCDHCLTVWLKYSQHCPQCRQLITSFGHSIRTKDNRICVLSPQDYKVAKVSVSDDHFVDSLSAAYLFEAFLLNREYSQYLDSSIASICGKISRLEVMLTNNRNVQTSVNIRHRINEENHRLDDMRQKKELSEENYQQICGPTDPEMIAFWQQVVALREYSDLN